MYCGRKPLWDFESEKLVWKVAKNGGKLHQHRFISVLSSMFCNPDSKTQFILNHKAQQT